MNSFQESNQQLQSIEPFTNQQNIIETQDNNSSQNPATSYQTFQNDEDNFNYLPSNLQSYSSQVPLPPFRNELQPPTEHISPIHHDYISKPISQSFRRSYIRPFSSVGPNRFTILQTKSIFHRPQILIKKPEFDKSIKPIPLMTQNQPSVHSTPRKVSSNCAQKLFESSINKDPHTMKKKNINQSIKRNVQI